MRHICNVALIAILSGALGQYQTNSRANAKERTMFATDECFAKGGFGIVNQNLYIIVKSDKNQLLNAGETWTGHDASTREVVIYFDKRIFAPQSLPEAFDLSKAVIVSFEVDKIRFFDFDKMDGCYYVRRPETTP